MLVVLFVKLCFLRFLLVMVLCTFFPLWLDALQFCFWVCVHFLPIFLHNLLGTLTFACISPSCLCGWCLSSTYFQVTLPQQSWISAAGWFRLLVITLFNAPYQAGPESKPSLKAVEKTLHFDTFPPLRFSLSTLLQSVCPVSVGALQWLSDRCRLMHRRSVGFPLHLHLVLPPRVLLLWVKQMDGLICV